MQNCRNCGQEFEVTEADLVLLQKLSPEVGGVRYDLPFPVDCPACRQQRRMSFRNERMLYNRKCDVTGKDIISIHAPDSPFKVCDKDHWYSDQFDPIQYGREYDFSRPFFDQFLDLQQVVPMPSLRVELAENCDYNNDLRDCKNCYLCARTHESQNVLYTYRGNKSRDCTDCTQVTKCELLYECVDCVGCYGSRYLVFCNDCTDCSFLFDCRNCTNCFMCTNLRNKEYCFLNEQLTKDVYEKKLQDFNFGSYNHVQKAYAMFAELKKKTLVRNLLHVNAEGSRGDNLFNCKNCTECFSVQDCEDCRHLWDVKLYKDSMDAYSGGRDCELMYYCTAGAASYGSRFCLRTSECQDVLYSMYINSSKNIFGSIGLRRSEYCILNKQYSEGEYIEVFSNILKQMQSTGEWGDFFAPKNALFPYNDTVAQEYFPLVSNEANEKGYRWREDDSKDYAEQTYITPDNIADVDDDVLDQILACEGCRKNFKIVPQELDFYRKQGVIIPRFCKDCRHLRRLSMRNPMKLRRDTCRKCGVEVDTTYPESGEMRLYCEECYQAEVY